MKIALLTAALITSTAAVAATPIDGWYAGVFGGYSYLPNNLNTKQSGILQNKANYKAGYHAGGKLGFKSNPLRYEGEIAYIDARLDNLSTNYFKQAGVNAGTTAGFGLINVYYDFPEMLPALQPFLGAGLGYGWVKGKLSSYGPLGFVPYRGSDGVFAYHATAGLAYNFAENYALDINYDYLRTRKVDAFGKDFQANLVSIGITYRFDENHYR